MARICCPLWVYLAGDYAFPFGLLVVERDYSFTRYVWAGLSGVLLVLSFPSFGHSAFAWIALVPLLVSVHNVSPAHGFGLGLIAGLLHFWGTVNWIALVMSDYGGLSAIAAWAVHGLLVSYLALFPACFGLAMAQIVWRLGPLGLLCAPGIWVITEFGRIYLFTGFPWELLGYSQAHVLPVAQFASLFGVVGVSALIVMVNAAIAYVIVARQRRWFPVVVTGVFVVAVVAFGVWRLRDARLASSGELLRVAAIQGNVAQPDKWDPSREEEILSRYLSQTRFAAEDKARLIIWPEAATPFSLELDPRGERVRTVARETRTSLLVGSTEIDGRSSSYYNAAFMIDASGTTSGIYRKQHLVPFGEYVPLESALTFVSPLVESVASFSAGSEASTLEVDGHEIGTAICYEVIYPGLVRQLVRAGSTLLVTITNDAWYGLSSAPYQHFQQATMRAVEQGRFLVRSANTGISGIIDPYGRVLSRSELFEPAVVVEDVRLISEFTVYGRIGDAPLYVVVGFTILLVCLGSRRGSARDLR